MLTASPTQLPSGALTMLGSATVELAAAPADGQAAGRPRIHIEAYSGGVIRPFRPIAAWPFVIDLTGLRASERIPINLDHIDSALVGQGAATIVAGGVTLDGVITGNTDRPGEPATKVVEHARNGFVWSASVGVDMERVEEVDAGVRVTVNSREFVGPLYVVRAGRLGHVAIAAAGADETATVRIAAQAAKENGVEFHEWLRAQGFDPAALDEKQRDALLKAFEREAELEAAARTGKKNGQAGEAPAAGGEDPLAGVLTPRRTKAERQQSITALVAKIADEFPNQIDVIEATGRIALAEDWSVERLELQLRRELRPNPGPARLRPPREAELEQEVIEAAICRTANLDGIEKHFNERVLTAAERRYRNGLGLGELLLLFASRNGYTGHSTRDVSGLLRAAFATGGRLQAAASTLSLPGIMSNVANKFVREAFMFVEDTWRRIAARRSARDFKAMTTYSLSGDLNYEEVSPTGELKHGTLAETPYTNQVKTYGKMLGIDRRDIVNDDLNALSGVPRKLGRGAATKINQVFWAAFLNNAAFFTGARGNYRAGANTALSPAALALGRTAFRKLNDPDGNPMGVLPRILLVPPELEDPAIAVTSSLELRRTSPAGNTDVAAEAYATLNAGARYGLTPEVSSYLSAAAYTGYSEKAWYLLADPNDVPVIEIAFLNGQEAPTIETADPTPDYLGIIMRGYHDFGVALMEHRGGVKMKGEA